jgi:hypothetical protein
MTDPAPDCPRIELIRAIYSLASNFENAAVFLTGEDYTKAMGDIAHARKAAARHNQNGPGCPAPSPLGRIAVIAHAGGLIGFPTEAAALNEIRRLTQPFVGDQINQIQLGPYA